MLIYRNRGGTNVRSLSKAIAALALFAAAAGEVHANAFVAWQVAGVPFGDTLNVRKYPASTSQKQAAYPNGTVLQMTGRCTGGVDLNDISRLPDAVQKARIRTRWCELWHDPAKDGKFVTGWVYGRYLRPY